MTTPSPSECLTFFRRIASRTALRRIASSRHPATTRSFISSARYNANEDNGNVVSSKGTAQDTSAENEKSNTGLGREHVLDKAPENHPNVQSQASSAGRSARAGDTGGHATKGTDGGESKSKAKQEFPEAPDTIGMQDERGGKW